MMLILVLALNLCFASNLRPPTIPKVITTASQKNQTGNAILNESNLSKSLSTIDGSLNESMISTKQGNSSNLSSSDSTNSLLSSFRKPSTPQSTSVPPTDAVTNQAETPAEISTIEAHIVETDKHLNEFRILHLGEKLIAVNLFTVETELALKNFSLDKLIVNFQETITTAENLKDQLSVEYSAILAKALERHKKPNK
jgi:hypothetical protein